MRPGPKTMDTRRRGTLIAYALVLYLGGCAAPVEHDGEGAGAARTVVQLPLGASGVHYADVDEPELVPWGPSALRAAEDGRSFVVDTAGDRLLQIDASGATVSPIELGDAVAGATDVLVREHDLYVLDASAMWPRVVRYSRSGQRLDEYPVPSEIESLVDGFLASPDGRVLLHAGGVAVAALEGGVIATELEPYALDGRRFGLAFPDAETGAEIGHVVEITTGGGRARLEFAHWVSSVRLLRVTPEGHSYWSLEEVSFDPVVLVDATALHLDAHGRVVGRARLPVADQYIEVERSATITADGRLHVLRTREDGVEIAELAWQESLPAILEERRQAALAEYAGDGDLDVFAENEDEELHLPELENPEVGVVGQALQACRTRDAMVQTGFEYVNSTTWLSASNMDRGQASCDGRQVPRYFATAAKAASEEVVAQCSSASPGSGHECIRSVPYDWGGADTVASYQTAMRKGLRSGDVGTKSPVDPAGKRTGIETCSRGTDCSGFITRAWDIPALYDVARVTTRSLSSYSTSISAGRSSHPACTPGVVMGKGTEPPQASEITKGCNNTDVVIETGDILLRPGSHVTMFRSFGTTTNENVDTDPTTGRFPFHFEATKSKKLDRVSYLHWSWSRFDGYEPRRFRRVCP